MSIDSATLDRVEIDPETGLLKRETLEYRNGLGEWGKQYAVHTDKVFNISSPMCKGDEYFNVILSNGAGVYNLCALVNIAKRYGFKVPKWFHWDISPYHNGMVELAEEAEIYINSHLCGEGATFMCTENGDWVVVNEVYLLNNLITF